MKKFFLDTNIFIDILKDRHLDETGINKYIERIYSDVYISTLSVHIAFYVLKVKAGSKMHYRILNLVKQINVIPLTESIVNLAMGLQFSDFEDALQYLSAINRCDYLLTRDEKDFNKLKESFSSDIKIVGNLFGVFED